MNRSARLTAMLALSFALGACASHEARRSGGSSSDATTSSAPQAPAAVNMAAAENASHVAEIRFAQNSAELSEEARQVLVNMLDAAQTAGSVDDVKVLAWADKDYPSPRVRKLGKGERDLAAERADNIRGFIKSLFTFKDIDTYNMAKRPNAVQRLFHTDDARLKRAMESAGIPSADSLNQARMSKASHAVVMVITK